MNTWNGRCYGVTVLALALLLCTAGATRAARVEVELSASAVAEASLVSELGIWRGSISRSA